MGAYSELHIKQNTPPDIEQIHQEEIEGERIIILSIKHWQPAIDYESVPGGSPYRYNGCVFQFYGYSKIKCKVKDRTKFERMIFNEGGKVVADMYEDELNK